MTKLKMSADFMLPLDVAGEAIAILATRGAGKNLFTRAVAMERNANLTEIKGLGRDFSWEQMIKFDDAQVKMFDDNWSSTEIPCGCYDTTEPSPL